MHPFRATLFAVSVLVFPLALTGCAVNFDSASLPQTGTSKLGSVQGIIHGGQPAIAGAKVYVYETSNTAYGGSGIAASTSNASKSLLTANANTTSDGTNYYVTSGSYGQFALTGDYTCDVGRVVYIYVTGGNPGATAGTNNTAIGELAMLGTCPSQGGNLASVTPYVYVNEVSTVAAAYALAGFATDATHIGNSGSTLAQTGLSNSALTAFNIANIATGAACAAPNCANTNPAGATGIVPQSEMNTLANIIASCINTTGATSAACTTLFQNATSDGLTCTTTCADHPSDTATAMINIAHFPAAGTTNPNHLTNLYGLQSGFSAFTPHLSAQPNDFTLQVVYSGGGLVPMYPETQGMESDASGNIWIGQAQAAGNNSNPGNTLSLFSAVGKPVSSTGIVSSSLNEPNSVAIDATSQNVWIANYGDDNVLDYNIANGTFAGYSTGTGSGPAVVSIDASSPANIWVAGDPSDTNTYFYSMYKINSSTHGVTTYQGGNDSGSHSSPANGILNPVGVAMGAGTSANVWVSNGEGNDAISVLSNSSGSLVGSVSYLTIYFPYGPAFDATGNAWFVAPDQAGAGGRLYKVNSSYAVTTYDLPFAKGTSYTQLGTATDGVSNVWLTNANIGATSAAVGNNVCEFSSAGVNLSGNTCFTPLAALTQPDALTLDISGNVWFTSTGDSTLTEMVGAAVPAYMPLAAARANNKLGARP